MVVRRSERATEATSSSAVRSSERSGGVPHELSPRTQPDSAPLAPCARNRKRPDYRPFCADARRALTNACPFRSPPLVERFGNMATRRAARGVLPFYYRDGDIDSTALLGEGERAVLEAAKPSKGAINTSAAHEALVRALGGEGTLAMDGLLKQPPLSGAFGFVASPGGSARPTDEMGYDEARAAPADAYSREYRDTSVFQLQFWRDPLSGGSSSGHRHDGQGGPEAEGADLPAAVTAYADFWSRTVTPLGAYVAAYVGCAPFPDVLADVDWAHAAVVHFRCSDVPFESQAFAHLESLEYADFLGARFAATHAGGHDGPPVKEVVPVLCTYHSSKRTAEAAAAQTRLAQYKCPSFLDAYLERIQAAYANGMREQRLTHPDGGAAVRLTIRPPVCVDERATLRAMLEARMAAVLFRSSFGFVACAPKGREGCIMPWLGQWELRVRPKGEVLPPERAEAVAAAMPWTMRAGAGLPHPAKHSNSARREAAWDAFDLGAASRNASSSSSGTIAEE